MCKKDYAGNDVDGNVEVAGPDVCSSEESGRGEPKEEPKKELTAGELLAVGGVMLIEMGKAVEDDGKISRGEWFKIVKIAATKAWEEYQD